jgi:hypothetical protein
MIVGTAMNRIKNTVQGHGNGQPAADLMEKRGLPSMKASRTTGLRGQDAA